MSAQKYINTIKVYLGNQFSLSEAQVTVMLPDFIDTLANHMGVLDRDLNEGDLEALGKSGHTMKGALMNLGLHDCATLALQIEMGGKAGDDAVDFATILDELHQVIDQIVLCRNVN